MTSRASRTTPNLHYNRDNGALSIFNISNNQLTQGEKDHIRGGYKTDMSGVIALADALKKVSRPFIVDALVALF